MVQGVRGQVHESGQRAEGDGLVARQVVVPEPPGRRRGGLRAGLLHDVLHAQVLPDHVLEALVELAQHAPEHHQLQCLGQPVVCRDAGDPRLRAAQAGRLLGVRDHEGAVVAVELLHGRREREGVV